MRYLILAILILITFAPPVFAQSDGVVIVPCLPANITQMEASGVDDFGYAQIPWRNVFKHDEYADFITLEGEQIGWLGYAKKGQESKEWYGVEAGFAGINMFHYGDAFLLTFYDARGVMIARAEIREYTLDDTYLIFFTTMHQFGLPDGSRYDYHIPRDPRGGACMFKVEADDFEEALGWQ